MINQLIQIVDENDDPIRGATKHDAQTHGLWHRIVKVLLRDKEGNILLQLRGADVLSPNCWDFSASGHVDVGEDYLQAALRELKEELSIADVALHEIERIKYDKTDDVGRIFRRFAVTYTGSIDHEHPIKLDKSEVVDIKWFTAAEVEELILRFPDKVTSGLKQLAKSDIWR